MSKDKRHNVSKIQGKGIKKTRKGKVINEIIK